MPFASSSRAGALLAIRYAVVAGGVMVLYLCMYSAAVVAGVHYFLAMLIAQVIAIAIAFPLYRRFVFASRGRVLPDFVRFLSVWVTGAVAGVVVTPFLVEVVSVDPIVAHVSAVMVVGIASFLAHKFFSFRASRTSADHSADAEPERAAS